MMGRNTIDHAWVQARLSDYIDKQLAGSDRAQLDQHLGECADCRARFDELQWTLVLLKQAPAPVTKRSFVLAVPPKRQPSFVFGWESFGAAVATLVLFAVIGFDLLSQSGSGGFLASAPSAAQKAALENAMPTQAIALAPQPTAAPTSAPRPTSIPKSADAGSSAASSSATPASSSSAAPLPPAPAFAMPTATAVLSANSATTTTTSDAVKSQATASTARAPLASGAVISATATVIVALTATATPIPPTATTEPTTTALIRAQPTRAPNGPVPVESPPLFSPVRLVEIGLLFAAVFMIVLVVLVRRKRS